MQVLDMPLLLFESQRLAVLHFDAALHRYLSENFFDSVSVLLAASSAQQPGTMSLALRAGPL